MPADRGWATPQQAVCSHTHMENRTERVTPSSTPATQSNDRLHSRHNTLVLLAFNTGGRQHQAAPAHTAAAHPAAMAGIVASAIRLHRTPGTGCPSCYGRRLSFGNNHTCPRRTQRQQPLPATHLKVNTGWAGTVTLALHVSCQAGGILRTWTAPTWNQAIDRSLQTDHAQH